jgi:hypothetical protein
MPIRGQVRVPVAEGSESEPSLLGQNASILDRQSDEVARVRFGPGQRSLEVIHEYECRCRSGTLQSRSYWPSVRLR